MRVTTVTLKVRGIDGAHGERAVRRTIGEMSGVIEVDVDPVRDGVSTVTVTSVAPIAEDKLDAAVRAAGLTIA